MSNEVVEQGQRLDRIEASIESLGRDVTQINAAVASLVATVGTVAKRQDTLESQQYNASRLNWAPVGIMASVLIAVAGISGALIASTIGAESAARVKGDEHGADILAERTRTHEAEYRALRQATSYEHNLAMAEIGRLDAIIGRNERRLDATENTQYVLQRGAATE